MTGDSCSSNAFLSALSFCTGVQFCTSDSYAVHPRVSVTLSLEKGTIVPTKTESSNLSIARVDVNCCVADKEQDKRATQSKNHTGRDGITSPVGNDKFL